MRPTPTLLPLTSVSIFGPHGLDESHHGLLLKVIDHRSRQMSDTDRSQVDRMRCSQEASFGISKTRWSVT